jgi:hypothetical protein
MKAENPTQIVFTVRFNRIRYNRIVRGVNLHYMAKVGRVSLRRTRSNRGREREDALGFRLVRNK